MGPLPGLHRHSNPSLAGHGAPQLIGTLVSAVLLLSTIGCEADGEADNSSVADTGGIEHEDASNQSDTAPSSRSCQAQHRWLPPGRTLIADLDGDGQEDAILWSRDGGWGFVSDLHAAVAGNSLAAVAIDPAEASPTLRYRLDQGQGGGTWANGDLNGDGHQDLVLGIGTGVVYNQAEGMLANVFVLLGDGDGRFAQAFEFVAHGEISKVAVADFNNDGVLDIVTGTEGREVGSDAHYIAREGRCYISTAINNDDGTWGRDRNTAVWEAPLGPSPLAETMAYCTVSDLKAINLTTAENGQDILSTTVGATEIGAVNAERSRIAVYHYNGPNQTLTETVSIGAPMVDTPDEPAFAWRYVTSPWADAVDDDNDGDFDILANRFIFINDEARFSTDNTSDLGEQLEFRSTSRYWLDDVDDDGEREVLFLTTTALIDGEQVEALGIMDRGPDPQVWIGTAPLDFVEVQDGEAFGAVSERPFACEPTGWTLEQP